MPQRDVALQLTLAVIAYLPQIVIVVVAIAGAIYNYDRAPLASNLVLIGATLLIAILVVLGTQDIWHWLPRGAQYVLMWVRPLPAVFVLAAVLCDWRQSELPPAYGADPQFGNPPRKF